MLCHANSSAAQDQQVFAHVSNDRHQVAATAGQQDTMVYDTGYMLSVRCNKTKCPVFTDLSFSHRDVHVPHESYNKIKIESQHRIKCSDGLGALASISFEK